MAKDQVKFLGRHWVLNVTRNISVFSNSITTAGYVKNYKKFNVLPVEAVYITKEGRLSYAFTNIENMKEYSKDLEKFYKDLGKMKRLEAAYYRFGKALLKASSMLSRKPTHKNYKIYVKAAMLLFTGFQPTNVMGTYFPRLLDEKLKHLGSGLSQQEIDILISDLTYPGKPTPLTQSQKILIEIGIMLQKQKKKATEIEKLSQAMKKFNYFMRHFSFIPVNFVDEPWTKKEVLSQLEKIMAKDCQKELLAIKRTDHQRKVRSKKLLAKIKDKEIINIIKALRIASYLNEYRKYIACYASLAYRPIMRDIAKKYKLKGWKECWKLTVHEVESLYFKGNKRILDDIGSRKIAGICFSSNSQGYRLMTENEINLFLTVIDKKKLKNTRAVNKIVGVIANKGIIRGIARVISGKNEFGKFRDGDIIVAAMTSVDFVPLMKRAAAYVTNEGGITSHAAIVSRELNKPCLVGTKNATEILKDGDLVEVDANLGVVRIIKRV